MTSKTGVWTYAYGAGGTDNSACSITTAISRGYTGHEMMDAVCLINANARIYDPTLGRFMSADPTVESPFIPQDLNRYSYVLNNPLSFTDPSGLCFLGCFWESGIFKAVFAVAVAIFVPAALGGWGVFTAGTLGAIADVGIGGALSGALSAGLNGGNILQGMLFGGAQALAFAAIAPNLGNAIGSAIGKSVGAATAGRMIANGLIGGAFSAAGGGNFGSGFLAAGVGSLGGSLSGGGFNPGGMIASAMIGGVASVLGGGKFANGAITAAFAYAAGKIGSRDAGAPDDQFAGPGARSGKPWTTEDFVEHYFTGNGETVDLGDVGLGDQFRNSNSVRSLTGGFIDDTLNQAQPEYSASAKAGSDVTNEPNLFAVGRSTLFMRAQCALNSCVFHFSIRDWFKDPGTIGGIKFFGGYELPGGTPYRIYYDWTALRPYPGGGK